MCINLLERSTYQIHNLEKYSVQLFQAIDRVGKSESIEKWTNGLFWS